MRNNLNSKINFTFSSSSQSDSEALIYYEYQNPEHTHVHIRRGGYVEVFMAKQWNPDPRLKSWM